MTKFDVLRSALFLCLGTVFHSAYAADSVPANLDKTNQRPADTAQQIENKAVGAWQLSCSTDKTSKKSNCIGILRITQQIAEPTEKEPQKTVAKVALAWIISKAPNGKLMTSIETPSGVIIKPGVEMIFDKSPAKTIPFATCNPQSCIATSEMNDAFLKQARSAAKVEVKIQSPIGKAFAYTFEPTGIKDVIKSIQ
jgi:invasion protein IalB